MAGLSKPGFGTGENISYGTTKPRDILIALAIDDGVESRGHRTNIFAEDWQEFGSCYGEHAGYRDMAVIVYRGESGSGAGYQGVAPGELLGGVGGGGVGGGVGGGEISNGSTNSDGPVAPSLRVGEG